MFSSMPVEVQGGSCVLFAAFHLYEAWKIFFNQVGLCLTIPAQDDHFILSCMLIHLVFAAGSELTYAEEEKAWRRKLKKRREKNNFFR